jgi:hypothetical protein
MVFDAPEPAPSLPRQKRPASRQEAPPQISQASQAARTENHSPVARAPRDGTSSRLAPVK